MKKINFQIEFIQIRLQFSGLTLLLAMPIHNLLFPARSLTIALNLEYLYLPGDSNNGAFYY